jgi:hypothetical protein
MFSFSIYEQNVFFIGGSKNPQKPFILGFWEDLGIFGKKAVL